MAVFGDLPPEVLENLFSALDRQSLMTASNVCLKWRKVIHDFTSLPASKCDSNLQTKLEKCGWIFGDHDLENCKCIELNTSIFKFIGNVSLSCNEAIEINVNEFGYGFYHVASKNKMVMSLGVHIFNINHNLEQYGHIFVLDESRPTRTEYIRGRCFEVEEEVIFAPVHDQTVVTVIREIFDEKDSYKKEDDQVEYFSYFSQHKILVWNHETLQCVSELNFHDIVQGFTGEQFDKMEVEIDQIAISRGKLAVNITAWTEYFEVGRYLTIIWILNTEDPSIESIEHMTTIEHIVPNAFGLFMNTNLLCHTKRTSDPRGIKIHVLNIEDLNCHLAAVLAYEKGNYVTDYDIRFDEDYSKKLVVLTKMDNILHVHTFSTEFDTVSLKINLNHLVVNTPGKLWMANFLKGKIMLILRSDFQFQCIIVTENGEVVEGNKQMFQLGDVTGATFTGDGIVTISKSYDPGYIFPLEKVNYYDPK